MFYVTVSLFTFSIFTKFMRWSIKCPFSRQLLQSPIFWEAWWSLIIIEVGWFCWIIIIQHSVILIRNPIEQCVYIGKVCLWSSDKLSQFSCSTLFTSWSWAQAVGNCDMISDTSAVVTMALDTSVIMMIISFLGIHICLLPLARQLAEQWVLSVWPVCDQDCNNVTIVLSTPHPPQYTLYTGCPVKLCLRQFQAITSSVQYQIVKSLQG